MPQLLWPFCSRATVTPYLPEMLGLVSLQVWASVSVALGHIFKGTEAEALGWGVATLNPGSARGLLNSQRDSSF